MGRLRVLTPTHAWLDICQSEWYVRNDDNTGWTRLVVSNELKVRHGSNSYWVQIECDADDVYCPPEVEAGCWPGYLGDYGSHLMVDGGHTGSLLCLPEEKDCVSYSGPGFQNIGFGADGERGHGGERSNSVQNPIYHSGPDAPQPCPATFFGGRAKVTEFYVDLGQVSGLVHMNFRGLNTDVRVRVYKSCQIVADTQQDGTTKDVFESGSVNGYLAFMHDTTDGVGTVLVRVDAPEDFTEWSVSLSCPNADSEFSTIRPAPCQGTYTALIGCNPNSAVETYHQLQGNGRVYMDIQAGADNVPVRVSVFYRGRMVATTGNQQTGWIKDDYTLVWDHVQIGDDDQIVVRFDARNPTGSWTYALYCPGAKGSKTNMAACCGGGIPEVCEDIGKPCPPEQRIKSTGADTADMWFDLTGKPDGKIYIPYTVFGDSPVQFLVYQNDELKVGTNPVTGEGRIAFRYSVANGAYVRVRVVGSCCPQWEYSFLCPLPMPKLQVEDASVVRGPAGVNRQLCFPLKISHYYDEPILVRYDVASQNAQGSENCVQPLSPVLPFVVTPLVDSVFQTWSRTDRNAYYPPRSAWGGQAASWTFNNGQFTTSVNSEGILGILSPDAYDSFTCEFTTGSADDDNDVMGGIIAHHYDGAINHYILAIRHRGGMRSSGSIDDGGMSENLVLAYVVSQPSACRIVKILGSVVVGGRGGWNGRYSRIRMERDGNRFTIQCSDWNMQALHPNSTITYDMTNDTQLRSLFSGKRNFGFFSLSQARGYFKDIQFQLKTSFDDNYRIPDFVPVSEEDAQVTIEPCALSAEACVSICGTDRVGPTRTISLRVTEAPAVIVTDGEAIGTIYNENVVTCRSDANVVVKDGGADEFIQNGARKMFAQDDLHATNAGFTALLEREIYLNEGTYIFALHGDDEVELLLDCDRVAAVSTSPSFYPQAVRYHVPAGNHLLQLIYKNAVNSKKRSPSYAAMAILRSDGQIVYASNAADWVAKIVNPGVPPSCAQFVDVSQIALPAGVTVAKEAVNIGYAAQSLQSSLHPVGCAAANSYYLMGRTMTFPTSGVYRLICAADDAFTFYIDGTEVASGSNWSTVHNRQIYIEAGLRQVHIMYLNTPACTPGWAKFAILNPDGTVFYLSTADGWRSARGDINQLGVPLYNVGGNGDLSWIQRNVAPATQGLCTAYRPNYAWHSAELIFNFEEGDTYTIYSAVDDNLELFIGCTRVAYAAYGSGVSAHSVYIPKGPTNIVARFYNAKAKRHCYFAFAIRNSRGQVVYATNPAGWKARYGDIDWSNIG